MFPYFMWKCVGGIWVEIVGELSLESALSNVRQRKFQHEFADKVRGRLCNKHSRQTSSIFIKNNSGPPEDELHTVWTKKTLCSFQTEPHTLSDTHRSNHLSLLSLSVWNCVYRTNPGTLFSQCFSLSNLSTHFPSLWTLLSELNH